VMVVTEPPPVVPPFPASPIGLTAQILLPSLGMTGTPGVTGATVNWATYGLSASQVMTAAATYDGYTSTTLAASGQRYYLTEGTLPATLPTALARLVAAGVFVQVCLKPTRQSVLTGGSTLAAQQSALAAFIAAMQAAYVTAGFSASNFSVTLWTEMNDHGTQPFPYAGTGGTLTFAAYWAAFAPVILAAGALANYNPSCNTASALNGAEWFSLLSPLPSQFIVDLYSNAWHDGGFIDQPCGGASFSYQELADGAGIPLGIGEYGLAAGNPPGYIPNSTVWGEFIGDYLIPLFSNRLVTGRSNAEILHFGTGGVLGSPVYNSIQSATDFKTGLTTGGSGQIIPGVFQMTALSQPVSSSSPQWQDISGYVYQRAGTSPAVTITRGRPNESAQATPSSASFQVNNQSGNFTAENPLGAWYGQIGRNTPVRFSVPAQNPSLRMEDDSSSYASTPSSTSLNVSGGIDVRIDMTPSTYAGCDLAGKWQLGSGGTQSSWILQLNADGTVTFYWSSTGTNFFSVQSTQPLPRFGRIMVRAVLTLATGTVTFWTAPQMGGTQTQLGAAATGTGGASTSVYAGTTQIQVGGLSGAASLNGTIHEFQLLNGGGTLVADPVFSAQIEGAASFTDVQGNVWTLNGTAGISERSYRYFGEMSSSPKATDPTLTDVYVPVTSGGILRRLQQGNAPEYSPMRRAETAQAGDLFPVAYYPCEDLQGSTSIGSAIGGPIMTVAGGTGDGSVTTTGPAFSSDSTFACSAALPVLNGSSWHAQIPAYESNGSIITRFLLDVQDTPPNEARIMRVITNGTLQELSLYYTTGGGMGLAGYDAGGTVFDSGPIIFNVDGEPVWVTMELRPGSGSTVNWSVETLQPGSLTGLSDAGTFTGTIGNATDVYVNPQQLLQQVVIGHVSVQSAWQSLFGLYWPLDAWTGETAGARFLRLCGENGIPARIYGFPASTALMGAQPVDTLPDLLQQCEDADRGMIYEPRQAYALGYRPLHALVNQSAAVTLDWSQGMIAADGWQPPTDDDQYTINDVTATRDSGGSSGSSGATYRTYLDDGSAMSVSPPPVGAGDYATSVSVNVQDDGQLPDVAGWMVHTGTVDEARWPAITVDLARTEVASLFYVLQDLNIGDRLDQVNVPTWVTWDDVRQLAAGVTEGIGGYFWKVAWNGIPETPYETGVFDDPVYGRCDTDGSALYGGISETATTFQVQATASGAPLWTTNPADFPFDIQVKPQGAPGRGERITVTGISGTSSPQTFTVTRSVNGVVMAHNAGDQVSLFFTPVYAIS
jgi:hypothetical protein